MKNLLLFLTLLFSTQPRGQWTSTELSEAKVQMGAVAYGSKVYFAGGWSDSPSKKVEIYDPETEAWTLQELSVARSFPAAAASGGKVFFAGGITFSPFEHFSRVDIYDTLTQEWSIAELSEPKFAVSAASYDNKVFFAGGTNLALGTSYATIDIYDTETDEWSTASLSQPSGVRTVLSGSKMVFVGDSWIDIYDFDLDIWSAEMLPAERSFSAVAAIGDKVIIAGGMNPDNTPTDRVDIYDVVTGEWAMSSLSLPRGFLTASASACGKAFFAGGGTFNLNTNVWVTASDRVDIYDAVTDTWTTDQLSHSVINHVVVANANHVFVAGGTGISGSSFSTVEIYTCMEVNGTKEGFYLDDGARFFANPVTDFLHFNNELVPAQPFKIKLTSAAGQVVFFEKSSNKSFNISHLPPGIYFVQMETYKGVAVQKIVKQ